MRMSPTEIKEGWSEHDVSSMLFYYHAQGLAREPDDKEFIKSLALLRVKEMQ